MGPGRDLGFELIETEEAMHALHDEWKEVARSSASPSPFVDPSWVFLWWNYFGEGRRLAIGVFRDGDRIVGLAPVCRRIHTYYKVLRFRRLEWIGAAGSSAEVWSENLGLIIAPGLERAVSEAFLQRLKDNAFGEWDECSFSLMCGTSPAFEALRNAALASGFTMTEDVVEKARIVEIPDTWEKYLQTLAGKQRRALEKIISHFEEWAEPLGYQLHRATDSASLAFGFQTLKDLHNSRWEREGRQGIFAEPRVEAFHRCFTEQALECEELDLWWLTVGGEPVAAVYDIRLGDMVFAYMQGRSLHAPKHILIALVLVIMILQKAIESGRRRFNLGCGDQGYKRNFTKISVPMVSLRLSKAGRNERLRRLLARVHDRLRHIKRRFESSRRVPLSLKGN